jgi:hypothetical protein
MHDPTYETFYREERDLATEREEEIKMLCWQECANCRGRGYTVEHWEAEDDGPDYALKAPCGACDEEGHIQIHDPLIVSELLDAADHLRQKCGVWCYTRIAAGLSLAINDAVGPDFKTVKSASVKDRVYHIYIDGCDCYDARFRAPKINHIPHCKHYFAVQMAKVVAVPF